jgi:hypothetical protein
MKWSVGQPSADNYQPGVTGETVATGRITTSSTRCRGQNDTWRLCRTLRGKGQGLTSAIFKADLPDTTKYTQVSPVKWPRDLDATSGTHLEVDFHVVEMSIPTPDDAKQHTPRTDSYCAMEREFRSLENSTPLHH